MLEDGWLVLNYIAFRDRLSPDSKAIATRERVRRHRERYKALQALPSVTGAVSASASAYASEGKGECENHRGTVTTSERISLDKAIERGEKRLALLKSRKPDWGWATSDPEPAEIKKLSAQVKEMKVRLGVPI